jgi:osmoprotectant transport system ATP-binding protein
MDPRPKVRQSPANALLRAAVPAATRIARPEMALPWYATYVFELVSVSKRYGRHQALDQASLRIPPQVTTVLLGPSGSGKSTLLRLMLGLVEADGGTISFAAQTLAPKDWPALRLRIGYGVQDGGLFPHLTARHNVTLVARQLGWPRARLDARLSELGELVRLPKDALDRYPVQLSGGQQQRVSLMRALMLDPDVLLLDEPLGALDPLIRADLQVELAAIFARLHKTVVLVTHDLREAAFLGHHVVLVRDGRIEQIGTFEDLCDRPQSPFVTRFFTAQSMPHAKTGSAS